MIFAYLDEFGHIGPFSGRKAAKFNESPVFGLAGILLPEAAVRRFATFFLQRKEELLADEIKKSRKMSAMWEKKGASLFRVGTIGKYPEIKRVAFRIINEIDKCDGKIFYYGREKFKGRTSVNAIGFYTTVLAHTIRDIDKYCSLNEVDQNFVIIVDEHSARKELLECAVKTMFGAEPARRLSSPPFEVESYLNQNIQAADWLATLIGRMWAYRLEPKEFEDHKIFDAYFGDRINRVATHSSVMRRGKRRTSMIDTAISAAFRKTFTTKRAR